MSAPKLQRTAEFDRWLAERIAEAPPLSDAQRAKISGLLSGGAR